MDGGEVLSRIQSLDDEHRLGRVRLGDPPDSRAEARLAPLEVALDRCWDLLRRRAGEVTDAADPRPERAVEGYRR